jgi:ABC-type Na+ efflux pump permease subunit
MRFLSVAERELRAGARQKATYRTRWITAVVFCGLLAWLMWAFKSFRAPQIFHAFSILVFFYCLILGTARTADCLSSEKREGTLGLLFLTNLNGPEIIGGKLCSSALAATYGLLAIFPLLALQMLIGGITLDQFWRTVLALADTIFFAVAAGFLASSLCVRQFTAIALATGLALFFSAGLRGLASVTRALSSTSVSTLCAEWLEAFSPLYTLVSGHEARVFGSNHYWWSVLAVTGVSWLWLALATWRVSWSWRDRPTGKRIPNSVKVLQRGRERAKARRAALRRRLLAINPFFWLGGRSPISAPIFMILTIVVTVVTSYVAAPYFGRVMRGGTFSPVVGQLFAWFWAGLLIHALVLYYAAMAASRRLAEDKQTGALELVLSTPTSERSISRGLWMAYGRRMFFPATVAILIHFFFIWQGANMVLLEPPSSKLPAGMTPGELIWHVLLNRPVGGVRLEWGFAFALRILLLALVLFILGWFTLGWLGRWLGLRMKHPGFAPIVSLGLLVVPPIVFFSFACYFADQLDLNSLPGRVFVPMMMWIAFGIGAGNCLLLSLWAAGRLRTKFRTIVTSRFQPPPDRAWWRPTRRGLLRFGIAGVSLPAALLIVVLSYYGYQNWQSRRAWSAFQNQLKQRGQSLDVAVLSSVLVPDNQNFALTPAFKNWVNASSKDPATKRLFDKLQQFDTSASSGTAGIEWTRQTFAPLNSDSAWIAPKITLPKNASRAEFANAILEGLKPHDDTLRALSVAAQLPCFQASTNNGVSAVLNVNRSENVALERLHMLLQVRACALLATNRNAEAAEDMLAGLRLAGLARQMPDSLSSVRVQTLLAHSLQPLWEGMIKQRWTAPQLASFQEELDRFNLLADHTNAIRRVVLAQIEMWRAIPDNKQYSVHPGKAMRGDYDIKQLQPRAWWYDNCIQLYQAGQNAIAKVDVAGARVRLDMDWSDIEGLSLDNGTDSLLQQYYWAGASPTVVVFAQTAVNQAIIACALERHRLDHGQYPETLEQLIPDYLRAIPNDVVRGRPMIYENEDNGKFTLRSVGPNQTNDRNKPASDDWLWSFPTNAPPTKVR